MDVDGGHAQGLAVVQRLDGGQRLCVFLYQVGQIGKTAASGLRVDLPPVALEGLAGGGNGDIDIFFGGFLNSDDRLLVGRVDGLKGLAVDAFDPFVVDKSVPRLLASSWVGGALFFLKWGNGR